MSHKGAVFTCKHMRCHVTWIEFPQVITGEVPHAISRGTQISPCSLDTGLKWCHDSWNLAAETGWKSHRRAERERMHVIEISNTKSPSLPLKNKTSLNVPAAIPSPICRCELQKYLFDMKGGELFSVYLIMQRSEGETQNHGSEKTAQLGLPGSSSRRYRTHHMHCPDFL